MPEQLKFDIDAAMAARDTGIEQVLDNSAPWKDRAMEVVVSIPYGTILTGEEVRQMVVDKIGPPHHHNAFGALIMNAVRKSFLSPTGRYVKMRLKSSHARKNPEYMRTSNGIQD